MRSIKRFALVYVLFIFTTFAWAQRINITLLQINDLYELPPVAGGKEGGMARVATLHNELLAQNPHTYFFLAGDAFSPSALGTAVVDGKPLAGKQMVSVLNAIGVNYATFGNHEFDISESDFMSRLHESRTTWFSGNVRDKDGHPFEGVRQNAVFLVEGEDGAQVRVGVIGVTLNQTQKPWVQYLDYLQAAREQVQNMRSQVDVLIALTHLAFEQDVNLAKEVPGIDLIMGGHEHENILVYRGPNHVAIAKADSNMRSAYIHQLTFDTKTRKFEITSRLQRITSDIPEDPDVAKLVQQWTDKGFAAFRKAGFEPTKVVANSPETLNGKETDTRNQSTNLTRLIADAMLHVAKGSDAAIYNSGSIRIDDELPPGPITQYDILRVMPFGGKVEMAEMKGALVERVLDAGVANRGRGGFLQTSNITRSNDGKSWFIKGQTIDPAKVYHIAIGEFLMTGGERGIEFLTRQNPDVGKVEDEKDVRFAIIDEMQARWPVAKP